MLYEEARDLIKNGDMFACKGYSFFSKAIRLYTHQYWSHIGSAFWMKFNGGKPRLCIFQSMEGRGIEVTPLGKALAQEYWPNNGEVWWLKLKDNYHREAVTDFYLQKWGDGYAYPYQFVVAMIPLIQKIRKLVGKPMKVGHDHYHCSETGTYALMSAGFKYDAKEPCLVTPGDLAAFDCFEPPVLLESGLGNAKSSSPTDW